MKTIGVVRSLTRLLGFSLKNNLNQQVVVGVIERQSPIHHSIQDNPHRPYIGHLRLIRDAFEYFRGGIGIASAKGLAQLRQAGFVLDLGPGESEI